MFPSHYGCREENFFRDMDRLLQKGSFNQNLVYSMQRACEIFNLTRLSHLWNSAHISTTLKHVVQQKAWQLPIVLPCWKKYKGNKKKRFGVNCVTKDPNKKKQIVRNWAERSRFYVTLWNNKSFMENQTFRCTVTMNHFKVGRKK
jgi:hypothetical protein